MSILEQLKNRRLICDGSMGTMLQNAGLPAGGLPEVMNITSPDTVLDIHKAYIAAGCDIITANTFGANRLKFAGSGYSVSDIIGAGVRLAKQAAGGKAFAALDIGPIGRLLAPFGDLDFEEAVSVFSENIRIGAENGCDLILIETMTDVCEIKAAMLAAKESCDLPVFVTFTPDGNGRLLTGADIGTAARLIESLGAAAVGLNCGTGPEQIKRLLPELLAHTSLPVMINPNLGLPKLQDGKTVFTITHSEFAEQMKEIAPLARIMGGCCGTTPESIGEMAAAVKDIPFAGTRASRPQAFFPVSSVTSYGKTVVIGGETVIVGERINPTGKPRMKKALAQGDTEYIYNEALEQVKNGAALLDINVGFAGVDEAAVLADVVTKLQAVTDAPFVIDTTNPQAAERALRLYNGKPLFNSISGKKETLDTFLPIIKKYGAAAVALLLDDDGIPETADGRVKTAEKIIKEAAKYGIDKKDIIADALVMTISADNNAANVTLETMKRVKSELGLNTILGISNISFGLPERERINAAFFTLAMEGGLSLAIANPLSRAMTDAYYTYRALSGRDTNCAAYIAEFSDKPNKQPEAAKEHKTEDISLDAAIINGISEQAAKTAERLLETKPPMDIINNYLIPALDKVGKDFEKNIIFLPQLLTSAAAAGAAFEVIRAFLQSSGEAGESKGTIVLATVKGDIHDIGINIVKALLMNYNYNIIDLGKNVEPQVILDAVIKEQAPLAGLSALMTTTLIYMEETIKLLKKEAPFCKIMVGGAVLTEDYAMRIGADFYSKDAGGSIRCAKEVFG